VPERLELEESAVERVRRAPREERVAVAAHQMRHRPIIEGEAVQPEPALERVREAVAATPEFPPGRSGGRQ